MLFEILESRRLMTFTFSVVDGILTVDGTGGNDWIDVQDQWTLDVTGETVLRSGTVKITERSLVDGSEVNVAYADHVSAGIVLNLHDGADTGSIDTGGPDARINGGVGNDLLTAFNNGGAFATYGHEGDDTIDVYDYRGVGSVAMGNGHSDIITIQKASSSVDSPSVAYGGNGDDSLFGELPEEAELIDTDDDGVFDSIVYNDAVFGHARLYGGNGKDYLVSYHEDTIIDGENGSDEEVIFAEDAARLDAMLV